MQYTLSSSLRNGPFGNSVLVARHGELVSFPTAVWPQSFLRHGNVNRMADGRPDKRKGETGSGHLRFVRNVNDGRRDGACGKRVRGNATRYPLLFTAFGDQSVFSPFRTSRVRSTDDGEDKYPPRFQPPWDASKLTDRIHARVNVIVREQGNGFSRT